MNTSDSSSQGQRGGRDGGAPDGNGFVTGDVLQKDDTSVTLQTQSRSTVIIFYSGTTMINQLVAGSIADLSVGQHVMANGKSNPDGSFVAESLHIRP